MRPHHIIAITDKRKLRHGPGCYAVVWRWSPSGWSPCKFYQVAPYDLGPVTLEGSYTV